jgi:hypothetical protein
MANKYLDGSLLSNRPAATPATSTNKYTDGSLDPAHQQARAYLDAHPEARHGFGSSIAGKAVQGMTLGWGDEALAGVASVRDSLKHGGMPWDYYEREKAMQDEQLKDATATTGGYGTAAEIAGGVGAGLLTGGGGLVRNLATGAGLGAVQGAGESDGNRLGGAARGAEFGAIGAGAAHAVAPVAARAIDALKFQPRVAPAANAEAMRKQAGALYDQFEASGGRYTRQALQDTRLQALRALDAAGYSKGSHGPVDAVVKHMDSISSGMGPNEIRPQDMQGLRRKATALTINNEPSVRGYGWAMTNAIDDAIDNVTQHPGFMTGGSVDTQAFDEANRLWRQASKSQTLERNLDEAIRSAGVTYSGGNETNKVLQAANKTYNQLTKNGRKLTSDEEAAFRAITTPSRLERGLRSVGKMRVGGGAASNFMNLVGGASMGPAYLAVPAIAEAAEYVANKTARRGVDEIGRVIRSGGVSRPAAKTSPKALNHQAGKIANRTAGPFSVMFADQASPAPVDKR